MDMHQQDLISLKQYDLQLLMCVQVEGGAPGHFSYLVRIIKRQSTNFQGTVVSIERVINKVHDCVCMYRALQLAAFILISKILVDVPLSPVGPCTFGLHIGRGLRTLGYKWGDLTASYKWASGV